jgi:hypothetical protein
MPLHCSDKLRALKRLLRNIVGTNIREPEAGSSGGEHHDYLRVQQIYRGWALLGIPVTAALVSNAALAIQIRRTPAEFYLTVASALCIALSLIVFFVFTFPVNKQTANWTVLPENWQELRRRWEYSHAVGAGLYFLALTLLTLSLLVGRSA